MQKARPTLTATTAELMRGMGVAARKAARALALAPRELKNAALKHAAAAAAPRQAERSSRPTPRIVASGEGRATVRQSFVDRLMLNRQAHRSHRRRPRGGRRAARSRRHRARRVDTAQRPRVPARARAASASIGIIYESRPNVTADAGALCLKAGNAAILRGGSDSHHSSRAIQACLADGLRDGGPARSGDPVSSRTTDRDAVGLMLNGLDGTIDVIVPRGGKSLVAARAGRGARAGVRAPRRHLPHLRRRARPTSPWRKTILVNAKMRRTGVCGATECLLIDAAAPADYLPRT